MPLSILVPMILVGLPLVIGLVWLVNEDAGLTGLTEKHARDRFALDYPNLSVAKVVISDDGKNAILTFLDSDEIGLVRTVGQNYLTRLIEPSSLATTHSGRGHVRVGSSDFTLKAFEFKDREKKLATMIAELGQLERS